MAQYISSNEREEPTTKNTLPARFRFRFDRDVKSFTEKQKIRANELLKKYDEGLDRASDLLHDSNIQRIMEATSLIDNL